MSDVEEACRHALTTGRVFQTGQGLGYMVVCLDCGDNVSLGPARDDGEHAAAVACELKGAEIAATESVEEIVHLDDSGCPVADGSGCGACDAWHLARCIATHQEPLTLDDVKSALAVGAEERKAAEQVRRKR